MNSNQKIYLNLIAPKRGEGEDDPGDKTFTQADIDAAVAAASTKTKDELTSSFEKTKSEMLSDLKKAKGIAKQFEGMDPEKIKTMFSAFENDQDLKDISEGRHEDVIKRRTEKVTADYTSKVNSLNEEKEALSTENQQLKSQVGKLMIDNNVVSEFIKEKGSETATTDVVLRANQIFRVENGELIPRDENGEIIVGKNGPMSINEYIGALKESAPHLFQGSAGSGAAGGGAKDDKTGIESKIAKAAESGDMAEYRRLRKMQKEGKTA